MTAKPSAGRFALLHALVAGVDPDRYFRARAARGEDMFVIHFPGLGDVLFTGTSAGVRDLFQIPADLLECPQPNPIEPLVGGGSLIMLSGERHRAERALMMPAFHGDRMRAYGTLMQDIAREEVRGWPPGATVSVLPLAQSITLQVIITAVFGITTPRRQAEYSEVITRLLKAYTGPMLLVPPLRRTIAGLGPWARFIRLREGFDAMLRAEIATRRSDGDDGRADVLSLLLMARYEDGSSLAEDDLCQELRTLLVAGHDTTATTLAWALFHVHHDAAILERLRAEVAALGSAPQPDELVRLPYLGAVCDETLRLHPAVPIVLRRLLGSARVGGVDLGPGDTVGIAVPALHADPRVWPNPTVFRPERFLERRPTPFEFTPFGGGHRRCVGAAFANYEMRIVLGTIMAHSVLALSDRDRDRPPPRAVPTSIATRPSREIVLTVSNGHGS